jgi:hypothetical protein
MNQSDEGGSRFSGGLPATSSTHQVEANRATGDQSEWGYSIWISAFIPNDIDAIEPRPGQHGGTMVKVSRELQEKIIALGKRTGSVAGKLLAGEAGAAVGAAAGEAVARQQTDRCFATDERSFEYNKDTSYRLQVVATGNVKKFPDRLFVQSRCGESTEYKCTSGEVIARGICNLDTSITELTKFNEQGKYKYRLEAAARNPLQLFSPNIDWSVDVTESWDHTAGVFLVEVSGLVDGFPAYEMYVQFNGESQALFRRKPAPGTHPEALIGPADKPVCGIARFSLPTR